MSNRVVRSAIA